MISFAAIPRLSFKQWLVAAAAAFLFVLVVGALVWRDDILRTALDPKVPYQTYDPPPAPDYGRRDAWALFPENPDQWAPADVFFVHPTTYDGGRHWNAPIDEPRARLTMQRIMAPNYAGPFTRVGRVFAPRYRQASLYAYLTRRDDAQDARRFAYGDVREAFKWWRAHQDRGRPLILVGAGDQGGLLAERLLQEEVITDPDLLKRLAGVYLIDAAAPAAPYGPGAPVPACSQRDQVRCVVGWAQVTAGDPEGAKARLEDAMVWVPGGLLERLYDRPVLCVNPLLGAATTEEAPARLNLGAANATGLEWGTRPAFLTRQVSAQCKDGLLVVSRAKSPSLRPAGSWTDRKKSPPYNLFYADIEADAQARVAKMLNRRDFPQPAPPIEVSVDVDASPIHRID
ncbi:DUF3089 domain-containing protein [Caulobacter sp. 17J65-9]|uniref:DUF3089 domain-containing protein n=1 Tax=Caulobacter sp. 17J65-9 TaxID=2709382 RepID=UPI0013CBC2AF|nr:DUF3089 domain-containing protein [Caulobacter sp. 17J65-9]NEX91841.1 DUF3089 domain-containing protein [Caulobacter sp. 17J65-9]